MRYTYIEATSNNEWKNYKLTGKNLIIVNDSDPEEDNYSLDFSFTGSHKEGKILAGESLPLPDLYPSQIFVKSSVANQPVPFRIFCSGEPDTFEGELNQDYNKPIKFTLIKKATKSVYSEGAFD